MRRTPDRGNLARAIASRWISTIRRADQCVYIPGVERAGERTVAYSPADGVAFIHTYRAIMRASGISFSP